MSAFNRRFEPARLFGMTVPMLSALSFMAASAALALMLSGTVRLLLAALAVCAVLAAIALTRFSDDLRLLSALVVSLRDMVSPGFPGPLA